MASVTGVGLICVSLGQYESLWAYVLEISIAMPSPHGTNGCLCVSVLGKLGCTADTEGVCVISLFVEANGLDRCFEGKTEG
jgi:hypothetical protein